MRLSGQVAQLVEQRTENPCVGGSIPPLATNHYQLMKEIKLNLGCGDKLLEGYINVDLVEDRSGVKPDVNCDLRNLSVFESDYADEILSVHVVEHFWR